MTFRFLFADSIKSQWIGDDNMNDENVFLKYGKSAKNIFGDKVNNKRSI